MSVINLTVKKPIGTIMFYIGVLLLGIISLNKLQINLLPDLSYPKLTVLTEYPGSGPEEIEKFITQKLEGPLSSIPGVKKISSNSKEGNSIITLEFHWGTDMDFALLHTKEKTEETRSLLPDDCEGSVILEWDPSSSPIIIATLKSDSMNLKELKDNSEFIIGPRLEQLEGISKVEIRGGDDLEVSVEIDPEKIQTLGITLSEIARAIQANNIFEPGGMVKKDKFRYILKIEGEIKEPLEIEEIVIKTIRGRKIIVKDVGRAFYKNKVKQGDIRFNSKSSIALLIYRESGGNTVKATEAVEISLKEMADEFEDLDFFIISREAELIISSINSLTSSLFLGGILAIFILLLFLQNYRDPIFVSLVIPISIISTFVLMYFFKVNLNIMSLGGLVLGVGMFVDNSIIVLESIFRHRKTENLVESVINGAKEVSGAITASTFTTISIFLPVIYLYGITGKLFRDQAMTVSFSLISSLIVAITLLPALSALRKGTTIDLKDFTFSSRKDPSWITKSAKGLNMIILIPFKIVGYMIYYIFGVIFLFFKYLFWLLQKGFDLFLQPCYRLFNRFYEKFDEVYHNILEKILNRKRIALYLTLFIIFSIVLTFSVMKKELLPAPDSRKFEIKANTIPAYGFDATNRIAEQIENKLEKIKDIEFVYTESGAVSKFAARSEDFSVNSLHFIVNCKSKRARPGAMEEARKILEQENLQDYSIYLEKNTLSQYLAMEGDNFQVKVFYEDINIGKRAVDMIVENLKDIDGIQELKTTTTEGKPVFKIIFRQELLDKLGLTKEQISNFINQAVRGEDAGSLRKIQKNFDIFVRVPVIGIMEMKKLLSLPLSLNNESYYLKDLIEIAEIPSIKEISRESQERFFMISGNVSGKKLDNVIAQAEARIESLELPLNTRYAFAGEEEERKKAFDSLNQAIWLAVLLVYMIMAAKFENILQPLIIMFTVPMGLIGAFLFLLIFGHSLSIISGIGILVLIGIGVNDAIVKVEYSNQLRREGKSIRDAVMTASKVRLRPILMTTFTTIFGLVPMAVVSQTGSELQKPLAIVIIGGLLFTTFLTLLLIPVSYEMMEKFKDKRLKKSGSKG